MKYSLFILIVLVSTSLVVEAKKKIGDGNKKYEGDFEFAEEVSEHFENNLANSDVKYTNTMTIFKIAFPSTNNLFPLRKLNS